MVKHYFAQNANLIDWRKSPLFDVVEPWKPRALAHENWPPNYTAVIAWRLKQLRVLRADPALLASARIYYSTRPAEFIQHWMDTYDPRKKDQDEEASAIRLNEPKWKPFVFFLRQEQFINFLQELFADGENGLVEKCRDAGATWLACAYTVWRWIFIDNDAIGWGSRKQELVDKLGDPSSIFEKMRLIIRRLPDIWRPIGLSERDHMSRMKLLQPKNGSVVTGEIGDSIGRGGRTSGYFKDESAHYVHPELIEAALGDNTNVQVDISSVNGLGNVFHKKREAGVDWTPGKKIERGYTRVFVIDWRDHPEKTQAWYDRRKAKAEREGLQHIFAQEVDRNYSAAVGNTIIPYEWIASAVDAHKKFIWRDDRGRERLGISDAELPKTYIAGLDVADGGIDTNALALRQSIIWRDCEEWGERDPGVTARRAMARCRLIKGVKVQYDSIGVGSNVKSEYNRLIESGELKPGEMPFIGWNAGAAVVDPAYHIIPDDDESMLNEDFFHNMKAQAWWSLRTRFYKTHQSVVHHIAYTLDEMISLDSTMKLLPKLMKEIAQVTYGPGASLRMVVNKKPDGTKSPNLADAGVMAFFPVEDGATLSIGNYGV